MTRNRWIKVTLAAGIAVLLGLRSGTFLVWAIEHNFSRLTSISLALRANPDAKDGRGRTALMLAADHGDSTLALNLLQRGARVNAEDNDGNQALFYARCFRDPTGRIARVLLGRGADPNARNHHGRTPLMQAAWYYDLRASQELIEAGARVDATDDEGRQALHYAAGSHDEKGEVVRLLLQAGADPNARTHDGDVPLLVAISTMSGATEANALQLIPLTRDINARSSGTLETALAIAASEASFTVFESLLKAGSDPDIPEASGRLPIEIAAGDPYRVQLLLKYGADPFLRCGKSPSAYETMKKDGLRPELVAKMEGARGAVRGISRECTRMNANRN